MGGIRRSGAGARLQAAPRLDAADLRRGGRRARPDRRRSRASRAPSQRMSAAQRAPRRAAHGLIRFYQLTFSSLLGRQCRYLPTCSAYADEAIQRHGLWAGGWMGAARICRCHPWGAAGFDPPPASPPAGASWRDAVALRALALSLQRKLGQAAARAACLHHDINHSVVSLTETLFFGDVRYVLAPFRTLPAPRAGGPRCGSGRGGPRSSATASARGCTSPPACLRPPIGSTSRSIRPSSFSRSSEMPRGATVVMSLGTNDAVAGALDVQKRVEAIVAAADAQGIKLYWLGPPCVLKPWESQFQEARRAPRRRSSQAARSPMSACRIRASAPPSLHAGDGVHFTMAGYGRHVAEGGHGCGTAGRRRLSERTQACREQRRTTGAARRNTERKRAVAPTPAPATPAPQ